MATIEEHKALVQHVYDKQQELAIEFDCIYLNRERRRLARQEQRLHGKTLWDRIYQWFVYH